IARVIIGSGVSAKVSALVTSHRNGRFHGYSWLFPVHARSISVARFPNAPLGILRLFRRLEPPSGRRVLTPLQPLYAPAPAVNIHSSVQDVRAPTPNTKR